MTEKALERLGKRSCLACSRARNNWRKNRTVDIASAADRHYQQIMELEGGA